MKNRLMSLLVNVYGDKRAVTIIEYALLAALIGIALITSLTTLSGKVSSAFLQIGTSL